MRIDLPQCNLKTCRNCFDGNCKSKNDYDKCDYAYDKNRLAELEDKLEQGTLIELPCKIGDTVYAKGWNGYCNAKVLEIIWDTRKSKDKFLIKYMPNEEDNSFVRWADQSRYGMFAEEVFLTESEAKAELERRSQ